MPSKFILSLTFLLFSALASAAPPLTGGVNIQHTVKIIAPFDLNSPPSKKDINDAFQRTIKSAPIKPVSVTDCVKYSFGLSAHSIHAKKYAPDFIPKKFAITAYLGDPQDPQSDVTTSNPKTGEVKTNHCTRTKCTKTCSGKKGEATCDSVCDYSCSGGMPMAPSIDGGEMPVFEVPAGSVPRICPQQPIN